MPTSWSAPRGCESRIRRVHVRPSLLLAILLYVTLDLCLPGMPGAFVFDAGDSVESVQRNEGGAGADAITKPVAIADGMPAVPRPAERVVPGVPVPRSRRPPPVRPPRTSLESPPPSEDPH